MLEDGVARLMQKFGSDLTLTRPGTPTYNPATGTVTSTAASTITARGVFIEYRDDHIDGTMIRRGDRKLLLAAQGATGTPAVEDTVAGLKVVEVRTIAPNGTPIGWACQMRA